MPPRIALVGWNGTYKWERKICNQMRREAHDDSQTYQGGR